MIPTEPGRGIGFSWRVWLFGVVLGPEVWEIHFGPVFIQYDPGNCYD